MTFIISILLESIVLLLMVSIATLGILSIQKMRINNPKIYIKKLFDIYIAKIRLLNLHFLRNIQK